MAPTDETTARPRLYTRIALVTGVPFGVLYFVGFGGSQVLSGTIDPGPGLLGAVAFASVPAAVLFGGATALVFGSVQWWAARTGWARRRAIDPDAPTTFSVDVRQSRTVQIDRPPAEVLRHGLQTHRILRRAEVTGVDEDTTTGGWTVTMRTGVSWRSWDERVVLRSRPHGATAIDV